MKKTIYNNSIMNEIWELSKDLPRIPITEVKETTWERETSIETIIYNNNDVQEDLRNKKEFVPGDIVMVGSFTDVETNTTLDLPHRIFVISATNENRADKRTYYGYMLTSKVAKSNKYDPDRLINNNIYISDYNSILQSGRTEAPIEIAIKIGNIYEFTLDQVMQNGYLGHTTNEFQQFVSTAARAYKSKKPTNKIMWIK